MLRISPLYILLLLGITSLSPLLAQEEEIDPASALWTSAMGWFQTGQNLEEVEQWPLALSTYIEALRQFREVKTTYPNFEPELIAYRVDALQKEVHLVQEKLQAGDHDVMMNYLDFIDSLEKGQEQRYDNELKEALSTLQFAKTILDEILEGQSEQFRNAVDSQYGRLKQHITWLDAQVNRSPSPMPVIEILEDELGTTEFIKESDLPADRMVGMNGLLFPEGLLPPLPEGMTRQRPPELIRGEAGVVEVESPKGEKRKRSLPPELLSEEMKTNPSSDLASRLPKSLGPRRSLENKSEKKSE